jgi:hypothetical protein
LLLAGRLLRRCGRRTDEATAAEATDRAERVLAILEPSRVVSVRPAGNPHAVVHCWEILLEVLPKLLDIEGQGERGAMQFV